MKTSKATFFEKMFWRNTPDTSCKEILGAALKECFPISRDQFESTNGFMTSIIGKHRSKCGEPCELFFNSFDRVFFSGKVSGFRTALSPFDTEKQFIGWLQVLGLHCGQKLNPSHPRAGGIFPSTDWRWHAVVPPMSQSGSFCLRSHDFSKTTLTDFFWQGNRNDLQHAIGEGRPVIVGGATGSGKSTLLNCLLTEYFNSRRVLILEQFEELPCLRPSWVKLTFGGPGSTVTLDSLVEESLRLRPDAVVIGESRNSDLSTFVRTSLIHPNVWTTIHARSSGHIMQRLNDYARELGEYPDREFCVIFCQRNDKGEFVVEVLDQ